MAGIEGKPLHSLYVLSYVMSLIEWIDDMITDEKIFPPVDDVPFPR